MNLINGTKHEVILYSKDECKPHPCKRGAFLKGNAEPIEVFAPGENLMATKEAPEKVVIQGRVFTKRGGFVSADPLPGNDELVFASNMYVAALKYLGISTEGRVATPLGPVYEDESATRPCGITDMEVG